jgi:hypothetical protein
MDMTQGEGKDPGGGHEEDSHLPGDREACPAEQRDAAQGEVFLLESLAEESPVAGVVDGDGGEEGDDARRDIGGVSRD